MKCKKDENLKLDPYFYERKEKLYQIRDGRIRLIKKKA